MILRINNPPWLGSQVAPFDVSELKAYYKCNEASGDVINQAATVGSTDAIATSDLAVTGATFGATGILGDAISFDGINDFMAASSSAASDWGFLSKDGAVYTVCLWVTADNFTTNHALCATSNFNAGDNGFFFQIITDRRLQLFFGDDGVDAINNITSDPDLYPNNTDFHFIVLQYDDGTGVSRILIDDGAVFDKTTSGGNLTNTLDPETFMNFAQDSGSAFFLAGSLDEISVWNRKLTDAELTTLFNGGSGFSLGGT